MRQQHIALQSADQLEWAAAIVPERIGRDQAMLENLSARPYLGAEEEDSMCEWLHFLQFSISKLTLEAVPGTKNGINVNRERWPKNAPARGAICRDRSNNVLRLHSIFRDYYVYVALGNPKSEMHGSLTGLTRWDVFEVGFLFVVEDFCGSHRKSSNMGVQALPIYPPMAQSRSRRVARPNSTIGPTSVSRFRT